MASSHGITEELGYFAHGSTIILLARRGYTLCPGIASGNRIAAGQALLLRPDLPTHPAQHPTT